MNSIKHLKEKLGASDVIQKICNYTIVKNKWVECPVCHRAGKFMILDDGQHMICKSPSCKLNSLKKSGSSRDIIHLTIALGKADDCKTALAYLLKDTATATEAVYSRVKTIPNQYQKIFEYYQKAAKSSKEVQAYVEDRWGRSLPEDLYGYAPHSKYLQEIGLKKEDLIENNICKENGNEVFSNRIIFPLRNAAGQITHFQGRSLDENDSLRWLSTATNSYGSVAKALFNLDKVASKEHIILTEGISDALSLIALGLPAVGILGNNPSLDLLKELNLKGILAIFDIDKYAVGTEQEGEYKSWTACYPVLVQYSLQTKTPIHCLMLPDLLGVKDVNDWCQHLKFSKKQVQEFCIQNSMPLDLFGVKHLIHSGSKQVQKSIMLSLSNSSRPVYEEALDKKGLTWLDIIKQWL